MKISQKVFKIVLIFFVLWGFLGTGVALAQVTGGDPPFTIPNPLSCGNDDPNNSLQSCVEKVLSDLLILATPIVAVMVIIGGYQILTAGGEPEKFSRGRKTILYAAVGFAIILMAKGVVFIIQDVFNGGGGGVAQCNLVDRGMGPCNTLDTFPECVNGHWNCP